MKPQICLGTAQFGSAYGVTNKAGPTAGNEVSKILSYLEKMDIEMIDTAQAYGNSESILGNYLPKSHNFRIISKLKRQSDSIFIESDMLEWEKQFQQSCSLIGVDCLDSFLLHSSDDLKKSGAHFLQDWLLSLKKRGLVKRLGISIYSSMDLEGIDISLLNLVQLPLSLYDQRLIRDGTISHLKEIGCAVHARSIYLQGLLMTPPYQWPSWIHQKYRNHHFALEELAKKKGCRIIDLVWAFAFDQLNLEAVVVGLCNFDELYQLSDNLLVSQVWDAAEWRDWAIDEPDFVDPRLWPT